ncbi:MAG: hydroxyacid dehydrogenase [Bacteroidetes bacterium GWF2_29_10]|nr:MAG: hydroxyacid dehydrogenase [Bacteroidetes bacterium GWF2_29_10]
MKVLFIDTAHNYLAESLSKDGIQCHSLLLETKEEIENIIENYEGIIIRSRIKIDKQFIDKATKLRFIARVGAGMENIDESYAKSKGIECLNSPEGNRDAVGEHAIGMLLSLFNNMCRANSEVKNNIWKREPNRGVELSEKTVGIIGYGNMGSSFAKKLSGFDVEVISYDKYKFNYSDKYTKEVQLYDIFKYSDIVSFHVPLTPETKYMLNDAFISQFSKNIYLINTSRGKVASTNAIVNAMKKGKVLGVALDVLEYEASSFEKLNNEDLATWEFLVKSDNVILSPHIAGWTHESNLKHAKILHKKIQSLLF